MTSAQRVDANVERPTRLLNPLALYLVSLLVGIVAGLGAVLFRGLIALFHNLFFLRKLSFFYDANAHTAVSPWGPLVIFVPVVGAAGVVFLVKHFAPEAKGHGVPEVIDAIYYKKGIIRPAVALIKAFASALSIGSGGSVGREGPIIQIGSSFGSSVAQLFRIAIWQRLTLIAAGTGAGIAATFNTPIGGILFAAEIMLPELSARTLVPVAIATATATYVGRLFFGLHPSFTIPGLAHPYFDVTNPDPLLFIAYTGLGIILGGLSAIYIKSIYGFEDFFENRIKTSYYLRHMSGMLAVGLLSYALMHFFGHYYVEGIGYATIQDILSSSGPPLTFLLVLCALKLLATSLTLGSGASGGVFSPALFMGATLGGAYGLFLKWLFPHMAIGPVAFAVAGMAGLVGGTTGAALAAIVMIFEMTTDYSVIIPMTLTVVLSYGVRRILMEESIYTMKLARRGHYVPRVLQANLVYLKKAREIMDTRVVSVSAATTLRECSLQLQHNDPPRWLLVQDDKRYIGVVSGTIAQKAAAEDDLASTLADVAVRKYVTVKEDTTLFSVLAHMRKQEAAFALVSSASEKSSAAVRGIITKECIADSMLAAVEIFED